MLLALAASYLLGLVLAPSLPEGARVPLAIVAMVLATPLVAIGRELGSKLWAAPLAIAALLAGLATRGAPPTPLLPSGDGTLEGTIESEVGRGRTVDAVVVVHHGRLADGRRIDPGARVRIAGATVALGARVSARGSLRATPPFRNASPHPPWPEARPIAGVLHLAEGTRLEVRALPWHARLLGAARASVRRALARTLDETSAGVACALVLGDGSSLASEDASAIRLAGLSHVLAVSGTHIAFVAGAFVLALGALLARSPRVHEPRRWAAASGIPLAITHAAFAGSAPSAWRAAATASLAFGLVSAGRRPEPLSVTALASIGLALLDPPGATRPGFLLSVLATIAVLSAPRHEGTLGFAKTAADLAVRSAIATAPVVVYGFGALSPVSIPANLVLVPLGGIVLLPLALVHAAVALVSEVAAAWTAVPFEAASDAFLVGSTAFAAVSPDSTLPPPTAFEGLALALASGAWLAASTLRARAIVAAALALAVVVGEAALRLGDPLRGELALVSLDVGQGDALFVSFPDGRTMLVDGGGGRPDPGERVLVPWLRARRVDRLDVVVLSHPHPDHYGGLGAVLRAFPVGGLWDTGEAEADEPGGAAAALVREARRRGIRIVRPDALCARPRTFGASAVETLHPCPGPRPGFGENDNSFVLRLRLGRRAFLLVGDAERRAESLLLRRPERLRADVLKVGHHGSRTSSAPAFVRAVGARLGLVSAGAGNRYGHPHPEPLAALRAAGTRVFRTDRNGGVTIRTDGRALAASPTVP